jgi:steroid delta-isomerase-like uncharacterized protein
MPQQNQTPEQNKQVVQRFVDECWNQGNFQKISEYLTDQVRFHDPAFPHLNAGIQNARKHIEGVRQAFPDLRIAIDDTIAERNEVVTHWTVTGTHKGQFLGMQPTQRKCNLEGTTINRLEGGKIAETHAHWNVASLLAQLGVTAVPQEVMSSTR